MADQKALKKRLKVLMLRPDNQICSDCPEKKPTWASLIVPPPGSPPGTRKIGAFCCLECSGSHRRLGVHISFVRSVNLDSWKEEEVRAMENGGNAVVNSIFEANLEHSGKSKPTNLADGPTRERFIRDKYERRKFYDPAGYSNVSSTMAGVPQSASSCPSPSPTHGTPSDVARQRVASRQARLRPQHSQSEAPSKDAPSSRPPVAAAPVSAPVVMDLLDFGDAPSVPQVPTTVDDPFSPSAPTSSQAIDPFFGQSSWTAPNSAPLVQEALPEPETVRSMPGHEFIAPTLAPSSKPAATNDSIMALFNTPAQPTSFASISSALNKHPTMAMHNKGNHVAGVMVQQQMSFNPGMVNFSQNQIFGMVPNQPNMNHTAAMNFNQQNQQHQPRQQNYMQYHGHMNGVNTMMLQGYGQATGGTMLGQGNESFNTMVQGMQQMSMGNQQNQNVAIGNMNNLSSASGDNGFGTPMGGNPSTAKDDPFSSLGGMNAFR